MKRFSSLLILFPLMLFSFSCCLSSVPKLPPTHPLERSSESLNLESALFIVAMNMTTGESITGSGIKVEHHDGITLVLSAGHVCYPNVQDPHGIEMDNWQMVAFDFDGDALDTRILAVDTKNDVCVFAIPGNDRNITPIAQKKPKVGERVSLLAFPLGIYEPGTALLFEGFYGGENDHQATYTIPVAPGASGGGIINNKNEVVGIISMATPMFETMTFACTLKDIQALLDVSKRIPKRTIIVK